MRRYQYVGLLLVLVVAVFAAIQPSNDREWADDQQVLSHATIEDGLVHIANVRNTHYRNNTDYDVRYYNKTYDIDRLEEAYFLVVPFGNVPGIAHTMFSFAFAEDVFVTISVEIRKEKGEEYSPWKGLFKQYEIIYVVADEKDTIQVRTNHRNNTVYLYPVTAPKEKIQALFLEMISEVNALHDKPLFYNTITRSCTTTIVSHINTVSPKRVPFSYHRFLPEYSDALAYELGLIPNGAPLQEIRERYYVTEIAQQHKDDPEFSLRIRGK